jgi:ring-1,2-phenylacetyl-CoA epoxidase subunit PaaC
VSGPADAIGGDGHGVSLGIGEDDPHGDVIVDRLTLEDEIVRRTGDASDDIAEYALWLGDDALILAHQLGWWISRAPELEEDIALGNIALDLLGHARSLLSYAGSASGRTEDDLAYWRGEREFRSSQLAEQPNGDYAHTIVRQLAAAVYMFDLYVRLQGSADETLSAVAAKAIKEVDYHRDHTVEWFRRLALGTDESRRRLEVALEHVWPYVGDLFRDEPLLDRLEGVAVRPSSLRPSFDAVIDALAAETGIAFPDADTAMGGGRRGQHSENLSLLLAEMQVLAREHPGASW